MEKDQRARWSCFEVSNHAIEVQANSVLVVVLVLLDLQPRVREDSLMIGPAGIGNVDLLRWVEAF